MAEPQSRIAEYPGSGNAVKLAAPILSALLFLSIFFIPLVGSLINPFAPLPLLYSFLRYGSATGFLALFFSSAIVGVAMGGKTAVFYLLSYGLLALLLGGMIRKGAGITVAVTVAAMVSLAATAFFFFAVIPSSLVEFHRHLLTMVQQLINDSVETYRKAGIPQEQVEFLSQNSEEISRWVVNLLPGSIVSAYFFMSVSNYAFYRYLQKRWTYLPPTDTLEFTRWSPPEQFVFALVAGMALSLTPFDAARIAGINIMVAALMVYFVLGMCIIQYWFEKINIPKFLRTTLYILVILQPFLMAAIAGTGLFDLWIDFRKIRRKDGAKEGKNGTDT